MDCARAGNRAGLLFEMLGAIRAAGRLQGRPSWAPAVRHRQGRPRGPSLRLAISAIVLYVDVHCYLRSFAAHVVVFAREIARPL